MINLLLLGIIFLPLVYWEVPKVWSYIALISIFVVAHAVMVFKSKLNINFKNKPLIFTLILFVLIAILASGLGADITRSIFGNYYRADGLITLIELSGFAIFLSTIWNQKDNKKLAWAIFFGATISSLINRFGQINFLVGFILVSLPFGVYLFKDSKNYTLKALVLLGLLNQLRVILMADSFVGIFGILIIYPLWLMVENRKLIKYFIIPIVLVLSLIIGIWYKQITTKTEYIAENRIRVYRNILVGSLPKYLTGFGWANTDKAFESVVWPIKFNNDIYVDKAHMQLLDIFSNTGISGLIMFLSVIVIIFIKLLKQKSNWYTAITVSLLMHLIFAQTNITSISQEFIFWIIVGIALTI